MTFVGKLLGGEKIQSAREIIKKTGCTPADQRSFGRRNEFDSARATLNVWRAKVAAVVSAVGILAGIATHNFDGDTLDSSADTPALTVPSSPSETAPETQAQASEESTEAQTDALIAKIEKGFQDFGAMMYPRIETDVQDYSLRTELLAPFEVFELNKDNPGKNAPRHNREMTRNGATTATIANPYYFGYKAAPDLPSNVAAGFQPTFRVMELSPDLDPDNLLDMLIVYHELRHSSQDAMTRQSIVSRNGYENYLNFYTAGPGEKQRVKLIEESSAYACELEVLNILLNGRLKAFAMSNESPNVDTVLTILNARENQRETVEALLNLAKYYYPEGTSNGILPHRFIDRIALILTEVLGQEPYIKTNRGGYRRYNVPEAATGASPR